MRNLTLAIDDDLLIEARKMALEESTTVNHLVRDFLSSLVRNRDRKSIALAAIERSFEEVRIRVGKPDWTRDDLHER